MLQHIVTEFLHYLAGLLLALVRAMTPLPVEREYLN